MVHAPEFDSTPIARPYYVLLPYQADGRYTKNQIENAPRIMAADDPTDLSGLNPGTLVLGTDGSLHKAGASGVPVEMLEEDPALLAIAALSPSANKMIRFTSPTAAELLSVTSAGAALLDDANAAAQLTTLGVSAFAQGLLDDANAVEARVTLGLVIGTNVQAQDATLQSLAALGTAADKVAYTTGVDTWAEAALTFYGRELIGDENSIQGRATMGLGAYLCRPVITLGAEAGDAIAVTLQMKDVDGNNIARQQVVHVEWFCSDADVVFTAVTTGTLLGALGTKVLVMTDATGLAVLTLTDTTPNFAGSGGLLATPASNGVDADVGFASFKVATFA